MSGVSTEDVLEQTRTSDPPMQYLVGMPKGRLTRFERKLLEQSRQCPWPGVKVKLLVQEDELYVFAESAGRVAKARSMRRRQLRCADAEVCTLSKYASTRIPIRIWSCGTPTRLL